ncbi:MAG: thiol-disulfide isomerase/thioredoxin [Gammaproteobacteria bacterium]|jgi:thiol-disulfide isomerase/thioredoxin
MIMIGNNNYRSINTGFKQLLCLWPLVLAGLLFSDYSLALAPGNKAPNIMGQTMHESTFSLSQMKSQTILINFFWINCKPCIKEMPELAELEKANADLKVLAIHVVEEPLSAILGFLTKLNAHPKMIIAASPQVRESYDIPGLPYTVIISNGIIVNEYLGYSEASFQRIKNDLKDLE